MHLVHINSRYKSLTEARDYFNGIVVISLLFEVKLIIKLLSKPVFFTLRQVTLIYPLFFHQIKNTEEDNSDYDIVIKTLSDVKAEGSHASIKRNFSLTSLLPKQFNGLYAYKGSLTTPPCNEAVTWFIIEQRMTISDRQVGISLKIQASCQ